MRRSLLVIAAVYFIASVSRAEDAPTGSVAAKVTLKKLVEKRELTVEKNPFGGWENGIELNLHVDGAGAAGARKVGKIKVTQATDDAGTDLTKKAKEGPMSMEHNSFEEVRAPQAFTFGNDKAPKPTGFDIDVKLPTLSARSAKTIKLIKGEMQILIGGDKKVVEVKGIKANYGKPIPDPALKAVGVTITVVDPSKRGAGGTVGFGGGDPNKSVSLSISGNADAVADVSIVNAAGTKLNQGSMSSGDAKSKSITYDLQEPLVDDTVLQIEVWPGQKTVKVPFELKDVKLP
jgi:hypothetical protein